MKTLAKENEVISDAISGVWQLTEEERIREECLVREELLATDKWKNETISKQAEKITEQAETIEEQKSKLDEAEEKIAKYVALYGKL